jgi:hypothetical protein
MSGNEIHDPCFSYGAHDTIEVACVADPWTTSATVVRLGTALPSPGSAGVSRVWAIALVSGERCVLGTGANGTFGNTRGGIGIAYECSDGSATSDIVRASADWRVDLDRNPQTSGAYRMAEVAEAWTSGP